MVRLMCKIVGEAGNQIPVDIDEEETVGDLIPLFIKNSQYPGRVDKLQWFPAKTADGEWLSTHTEAAKDLKKGKKNALIDSLTREDRELVVESPLRGFLDNMEAPQASQIHVLVKSIDVELKRPAVDNDLDDTAMKRLMGSNMGTRLDDVGMELDEFDDIPQITIDIVKYVTLPAAFVDKCGLATAGDLKLFCRPQVYELWNFLRHEVIMKNGSGRIVGPPGTGKSACTLCFAVALDPNKWNVVWIHLSREWNSCLVTGIKKYGPILLSSFKIPRVKGKRLFLCVDGYKAIDKHAEFLQLLHFQLRQEDRLVVCSSMATLGKRNADDDAHVKMQVFFMYSWTLEEYFAAITDQDFYEKILPKLDATGATDVNEEVCDELSERDKLEHSLRLKFYYAGGSCRFMFQFHTSEVINNLNLGIESAPNKELLIRYCSSAFHSDEINMLYGMKQDNIRFPVSSYAASLFADQCGDKVTAGLAARLNASCNPAVDGHLFEWLFFAAVPRREVVLFGDNQDSDVLPQARVLRFNPKKRFVVKRDKSIGGNQSWLQPVAWNQGGYDAVYFDQREEKVIFVQVTRSNRHDFKMFFFNEVLLKLKAARMKITNVEVFVVVKASQLLGFKLGHIEGRHLLRDFDERWGINQKKTV